MMRKRSCAIERHCELMSNPAIKIEKRITWKLPNMVLHRTVRCSISEHSRGEYRTSVRGYDPSESQREPSSRADPSSVVRARFLAAQRLAIAFVACDNQSRF